MNKITDLGVKHLAENGNKFSSLRSIHFYNNQITGTGLKTLAENGDKFSKLQIIQL